MAYNFIAASSQYLSAPAPINGNTFPFTLACWHYQTTLNTGLLVSLNSTNGNYIGIAAVNTGVARILHSSNAANDTTTTASAASWNHYCGVVSANNSRTIYLNAGGQTTGTATELAPTTATNLFLGARRISGAIGTYATGLISEVGIWNTALTAAEIASLAKGMTCDKIHPQSLVFYAPLVRDLIDQKGGRAITNNNGATVANHTRVYA